MDRKIVWNRASQMPPGREFEAYHLIDNVAQPMLYHNHPYYEFYFYLQGHSHIIVEGLNLQPVRGDVLIYPPGVMHRNTHLDAQIPYERFYIYARKEFLQYISAPDYDIPATIERMTRNDQYYFHVDEDQLRELVASTDALIEGSFLTGPADKLLNQFRMGMLLVQALTMMTSLEAMPQSEYSAGMSRLIRYINRHVCEPITLDELAEAFFVSKYYLLREFKKYTGISVHQYMIIRRVMLAQEMLAQGAKPREASTQCGFSDYSCFYRAFKARAGVSPEQYRSAHVKP